MKPIVRLSENKYLEEEILVSDFSIKGKDLEEYSEAIADRLVRINNIRKLYSGTDFNTPIYELAFKKLLEKKDSYRKDFVVPFEKLMEQDLVLTPNETVRLISFSPANHVYNTKELKGEGIFFNYGPNTRKVASLYISKDGNFGFLIRFNRYNYRGSGDYSDGENVINDGEFKGEAYESTLVNLIMFFSSIINNKETNILATIEQIVGKNPSSTIANVYLKTKENLDKIENVDKEFSEALVNADFAKRSKIEYIEAIKTSFLDEILPIQFYENEEKSAGYGNKHPLFTYKLVFEEGKKEKNFFLHYLNTYKTTYTDEGLLIPAVVRIKEDKMFLLYAINKDGTLPPAAFVYSNPECEIEEEAIKISGKEYSLVESGKYLPILKQGIVQKAVSSSSYYLEKLNEYHKKISLNFITKVKSSKRRVSLIESKLVPYEYKLKIINVLSEILVKAFTNEIFIKKI